MSNWAKLGITINDLSCFKASCSQNGVEYIKNEDANYHHNGMPVEAILKDLHPQGRAGRDGYLVRADGAFKVVVDNDPNYSSITRRLGRNGGRLTRDYTTEKIRKNVAAAGGMINSMNEADDGSVVVRIGII